MIRQPLGCACLGFVDPYDQPWNESHHLRAISLFHSFQPFPPKKHMSESVHLQILCGSYCWWLKSQTTSWGKGSFSTIIYRVSSPSQVVGNGISAINSMNRGRGFFENQKRLPCTASVGKPHPPKIAGNGNRPSWKDLPKDFQLGVWGWFNQHQDDKYNTYIYIYIIQDI